MKTAILILVFSGIVFGMSLSASAVQSGSQTQPPDYWNNCSAIAKIGAVGLSSVTAFFGLIIGWAIFPITIAPITYLMQSELAIWGSRLAMSIGCGICGFIFPFQFLIKAFSS